METVFSFREPVVVQERVVVELCRLARRGYETRHKRETFGFVFGTLSQDRRLTIRRAVYYRGGNKSRSGIWFGGWSSVRRVIERREQLARRLGMRFLGGFHSHVEIAGRVFQGLSESDRRSLRRDWLAELEVITFVWAGAGRRPRPSAKSVACFEPATGYNYRTRVYAKFRSGIRMVRLNMPGNHRVLRIPHPGHCP